MMKVLENIGLEETCLNIIKALYEKPTASIILNEERVETIQPKSGTRQGCPSSPLLFNIVVKVLVKATRQEKDIEGIQIENNYPHLQMGNERFQMPYPKIFRDDKKNQKYSKIQGQFAQINSFSI